jgi:alkylhydroperoxidase family enzyme
MRLKSANNADFRRQIPASMVTGYRELVRAMWADSTLDIPLREMLRLKSADLAHCRHWLLIRVAEAQQQGLTEDKIAQIHHPESSTLPDREKYALLFAELYITNPEAVTDGLVEELQKHFTNGQIAEIMYFTGTMNTLQRFNTAMDVDPEDGDNLFVRSVTHYERAVAGE